MSQGDVSLGAENKPPDSVLFLAATKKPPVSNESNQSTEGGEAEEEGHHFLDGHTSLKFLLAGGVAGAGGSIPLCCR